MAMKKGVDFIGVGIGAVIIDKKGRIFLSKRGRKARNEVGKWECPGGALEFADTMERTIIREIREEFGIDIEVLGQMDAVDHIIQSEKQHWVAVGYLCRIKKGVPKILEPEKCTEIGWFTISQMKKMPLTIPAAYRLVELMKKYPKGIPSS